MLLIKIGRAKTNLLMAVLGQNSQHCPPQKVAQNLKNWDCR